MHQSREEDGDEGWSDERGQLDEHHFRVGTFNSACLAINRHLYTQHRKDKEPKSGSGGAFPVELLSSSINRSKVLFSQCSNTTPLRYSI
jgi:hypothetical protein